MAVDGKGGGGGGEGEEGEKDGTGEEDGRLKVATSKVKPMQQCETTERCLLS